MRCVQCGGPTKVLDSRDDRNARSDWLLRSGARVFGWWCTDFRLRKRRCLNCGHRETTIEVTLDDLRDSIEDLKTRLTVTDEDLRSGGVSPLSDEELEALSISLESRHNRSSNEALFTRRTVHSLVSELRLRRNKQPEE